MGKVGPRQGRQEGRSQRTWYSSKEAWFCPVGSKSRKGLEQERDITDLHFNVPW